MEYQQRTDRDVLNWVLVGLALALAGIHLYLGLLAGFVSEEETRPFLIIGVVFLAGLVIYFTPYWRPVLYLLGTWLALYLGIVWVFGGMRYFIVGIVTGSLSTGFFILTIYLFIREETFIQDA